MDKCPHCGKNLKMSFDEKFHVGQSIIRIKGKEQGTKYTITAIGKDSFLAVDGVNDFERKFSLDVDAWKPEAEAADEETSDAVSNGEKVSL